MANLLERLPSGSRIAVIRLRSLGDCVLTTPALALLKGYRPDLRITVVAESRFEAVFQDNPDVAEVCPSVTRGNLALNLHGGVRSMFLTLASRAKLRAGFAHHRYSFIYSDKIPTAQEILRVNRPVHTAEHLASAMFWMGVPETEIPRAKLIAAPPPDLPAYAVMHAFASSPEKTWPAERFIVIAQHLKENYDLETVFVAGPLDDTALLSKFRVWKNTPLAKVKSLMSGAQIFIGNDSGPAHIAAAFGVPVVVLFGASNPVTWAPWRTESQVLTSSQGIGAISVAEVLAAVEKLKVRA